MEWSGTIASLLLRNLDLLLKRRDCNMEKVLLLPEYLVGYL